MVITSNIVSLDSRIANRIRGAELPAETRACYFKVDYDSEVEAHFVRVLVVLDFDDWGDQAADACEVASNQLWSNLLDEGAYPNLVCRTKAEHKKLGAPKSWTAVSLDGDC